MKIKRLTFIVGENTSEINEYLYKLRSRNIFKNIITCRMAGDSFSTSLNWQKINKSYKNNIDVLIDYIKNNLSSKDKYIIIIDNIELFLSPTKQSEVIPKLLETFPDFDFVIATHSPYILTSTNTLIEAHNTYLLHKDKEKKISKIVPKSLWLPFDQVQAFEIKDGRLIDILDYETNLINDTVIDSVSDEIGTICDKLLEIKYPD